MLCSLEEILDYKNAAVVTRFQKEFPDKAKSADTIFSDLLRFFWGTKKHALDRMKSLKNEKLDFVFIMDEDMREIDQIWHIFLLYTRDYSDFCKMYFGEFLHHQPDLIPIFETRGFLFESNLERFLAYNFELFGEDVIRRWFNTSLHNQNSDEFSQNNLTK